MVVAVVVVVVVAILVSRSRRLSCCSISRCRSRGGVVRMLLKVFGGEE